MKPTLENLNKLHAVIINQREFRILNEHINENDEVFSVDFSKVNDFKNRYAPYEIDVKGKNKPLADEWLKWPDRRTYTNGVCFAP